jgi:hypothetical protein
MLHSTFREPALTQLTSLHQVDLAIGLPTHKTKPQAAARITRTIIAGLEKYYPHLKAVILNADSGLKAGTRKAIEATATKKVAVVAGRYTGVLGRGAALSAILHGAVTLQAKAIIILDCWSETITPEWVPALASSILDHQVDLVRPRYDWPLPDGALDDLLFYPFCRAVWGLTFQHPAAFDFAISARLAQAVLAEDVWETEVNGGGFDIWLNILAAIGEWRLAQTALGLKQYRVKQHPELTLTGFKEAAGTMLRQLHLHQKAWPAQPPAKSLPTLTKYATERDLPVTPPNDCTDYIDALMLGWVSHRALWQKILLPENLGEVERLASQAIDQFYFPPDLWTKIVYDFAVVYNKGEVDPDAVVAALQPLYLGRLASFWTEVAGLTTIGRAGTVAAQGVEFEEHLPYLQERWENYKPWPL